ncbi:hypothetical protein ACSBR2_010538 [Camellia fascicularis]
MDSRVAIWGVGMLFFSLMVVGESGGVGGGSGSSKRGKCEFPAIFNFGDSNSDTGAGSAAFGEIDEPNGMNFHLRKRSSDGRLIIDFFAEKLGLPYLDAPLDTIGTSFKHGANFAVGGSKISPIVLVGSTIPLHLGAQVSEFLQFKSRTIALSHHHPSNTTNNPRFESNYPEPEVFSKALYTIDIGHNDISYIFYNSSVSTVVNDLSNSVQRLLESGAKNFWIHNTGPHGCLPGSINGCKMFFKEKCELDENGCVKRNNKQAVEFNKLLKEAVYKLRAKYPHAAITYVDVHSSKNYLVFNAKKLGFTDPFSFCCGTPKIYCGTRNETDNKLLGTACSDPSKYIVWDGVHYTQAGNRFVANLIMNGSFSDPPLPLSEACHKV